MIKHRRLIVLVLLSFSGVVFVPSTPYAASKDTLNYQEEGLRLLTDDTVSGVPHERYMNIAFQLEMKGKYDATIYWYERVLLDAEAGNEIKADAYRGISKMYAIKGLYMLSIEKALKSLALSSNELSQAKTKLFLTEVYVSILDYDQGMKYVNASIAIFLKRKDFIWLSLAMDTKSRIAGALGDTANSIKYLIQAKHYIDSFDTTTIRTQEDREVLASRQSGILNNLADNYLKINRADSALYYLALTDQYLDLISAYLKASIYLSYGEAFLIKDNPRRALAYFNTALSFGKQAGTPYLKTYAFKGISTAYGKLGNYREAWHYQQQYIELNEAVISRDNIHKINQLRTNYVLEKKDKEMAEKELDFNKKQSKLLQRNHQLILIVVSVSLSAVAIGIFFRNQYNKNRYLRLQLKNTEKENHIKLTEAILQGEEMERERIAKELHDAVVGEVLAFNLNLQALGKSFPGLTTSDDYRVLLNQSQSIAHQLRETAHNLMPDKIEAIGLIASIRSFIDRINNHKIHFIVQELGNVLTLKPEVEKVLLLSVLELAQNIIKHSSATEAIIQLNYSSDLLTITIEDNGVGIPKHRTYGMGLSNLIRNMEMLNGQIDIQSSEYSGTTILLEISLMEHAATSLFF